MRQKHRKTTKSQKNRRQNLTRQQPKSLPFLQHIYELRRRLIWIALAIIGFSILGYILQKSLIGWLLKPAADQQFIYTTPGGGINFILQVAFYFGIACSIPIMVYHLFRFAQPLLKRRDNQFIIKCALAAALLAVGGIAFGYYIGLPAAIHFLDTQLQGNTHIQALLTISDYLSFVTIYLAGAAIMFQLPIIIVFINRIKPLQPKKLLKIERWVILGAFIVAAIITPTPDMFNQSLIAVPIILVYQIGVIIVWFQNHYSQKSRIDKLLAEDSIRQKERELIRQNSQNFHLT